MLQKAKVFCIISEESAKCEQESDCSTIAKRLTIPMRRRPLRKKKKYA